MSANQKRTAERLGRGVLPAVTSPEGLGPVTKGAVRISSLHSPSGAS